MPNIKGVNSISKTLEELVLISGLSGYETNVKNYLSKQLKNKSLKTTSDILGNLICTMKGDETLPSVILFAHMDQLGFVVKKIEDNGFIRVERVGGIPEKALASQDIVIGIAASGTTPYVIEALRKAQEHQIPTACICCNPKSPLTQVSDYPIEVVVGPEFVTGSSRMKAGTAQKMILNMISTATMIQLGHIRGNKMVDMQLSNDKLTDRAERMVMEATGANLQLVQKTLQTHRSARKAIDELNKKTDFKLT